MSDQGVSYLDRDGSDARVGYCRTGQGPAVVLLHGVGLRRAIWHAQVDALKMDHDVIAVDMLGHGTSSRPSATAGLLHYADAVRALLDSLRIRQAHIIGHSMGALVALEFALQSPDRTASVVAMNAVFCRTPEQRAAVEARVAALDGEPGDLDWSGTIERWFGEPVPAHLKTAAASTGALLSAIDLVGYRRAYRLFSQSDAAHRERLPKLMVPTLFITGEQDPNSTPAMSEAMARITPGARLKIVPAGRHMMFLTDPRLINCDIRTFIDEASRVVDAPRGSSLSSEAGPSAASSCA